MKATAGGTMTDEQLEQEWQEIERAIERDRDGYFNAELFSRVLAHSKCTGETLLVLLAIASFGDSRGIADPSHEEIISRRNAILAFFQLEERAGRDRLHRNLLKSIGLQRIPTGDTQ